MTTTTLEQKVKEPPLYGLAKPISGAASLIGGAYAAYSTYQYLTRTYGTATALAAAGLAGIGASFVAQLLVGLPYYAFLRLIKTKTP